MEEPRLITIRDIKKSFGANNVLRGLNCTIDEGSIYGLIGKNGAGKTTLMNIMAGLSKADSGEVEYNKGSKVGYLPDLPNFFDYLTTDEYLDFLLMDKNPARRDELLKTVGLPKGAKVKTMSRGMKQRLGIAAVLVNDPDVILLDEPTSALDPSGRNDVKDILLGLKAKGKTVILSTHILADMDSICDKAGFLSQGVIAREVNVKEESQIKKEMVISFTTEPDLKTLYNYTQKIIVVDPKTIRIVLDEEDKAASQKKVFEGLTKLPQEVSYISTVTLSLDNIFREVCI